jgi:hypothetical protein
MAHSLVWVPISLLNGLKSAPSKELLKRDFSFKGRHLTSHTRVYVGIVFFNQFCDWGWAARESALRRKGTTLLREAGT